MTEHDPQPGELWETDAEPLSVSEARELAVGLFAAANQGWIGLRSVGYTAEYVENLRAERDSAVAAVKRVEALADEWAALAVPPTYASMDNGYAAAEVRRALAGEVDE